MDCSSFRLTTSAAATALLFLVAQVSFAQNNTLLSFVS
jgi:hypothetical protein